MRRALAWLLFLTGLSVHGFGQTQPVVRIVAISPDPATLLAAGQNLNARVAYESKQPLRLQATGYRDGNKQTHLSMNASPIYPAGSGEALVFVFGQPGARIDELRVGVFDQNWRPLVEVPVKVEASWRAGVAPAPTAGWVQELGEAQGRAISAAFKQGENRTGFDAAFLLVPLMGLTVIGYPLLQAYALWRLSGPARLWSALPLSFMLPVYAFCIYALLHESNLWPLFAIFGSPVAFLITLIVLIVARRRERQTRSLSTLGTEPPPLHSAN